MWQSREQQKRACKWGSVILLFFSLYSSPLLFLHMITAWVRWFSLPVVRYRLHSHQKHFIYWLGMRSVFFPLVEICYVCLLSAACLPPAPNKSRGLYMLVKWSTIELPLPSTLAASIQLLILGVRCFSWATWGSLYIPQLLRLTVSEVRLHTVSESKPDVERQSNRYQRSWSFLKSHISDSTDHPTCWRWWLRNKGIGSLTGVSGLSIGTVFEA